MRQTITDQVIRLSTIIEVAPADLWPLLTDNAHIAKWWGNHVTIEPHVGGSLREVWRSGTRTVITSAHIREFMPPSRLAMDWADDDWPGNTTLQIEIAGHSGGSALDLVHDGWGIHPIAARGQLVADHAAGWENHLRSLKSYAERQIHPVHG